LLTAIFLTEHPDVTAASVSRTTQRLAFAIEDVALICGLISCLLLSFAEAANESDGSPS